MSPLVAPCMTLSRLQTSLPCLHACCKSIRITGVLLMNHLAPLPIAMSLPTCDSYSTNPLSHSHTRMFNYTRNGDEIYHQSFAIIRAEAPLDLLPADLAHVAVRLIHACGMTDIVHYLAASTDPVTARQASLG